MRPEGFPVAGRVLFEAPFLFLTSTFVGNGVNGRALDRFPGEYDAYRQGRTDGRRSLSSRHGNGSFIWAPASRALCPAVGTEVAESVAVRTVDTDSRPCRAFHG